MKLTLVQWWGLSNDEVSIQSINKKSSLEWCYYLQLEQTDFLYGNAKDLIQSRSIKIRVASLSLVSFCHLSVLSVADVYPISIYIISPVSCSLEFSPLEVKYDIFRDWDEGTWQKHPRKYLQHNIVDHYAEVCQRHCYRQKKPLRWKSTHTHTHTHTHTQTHFIIHTSHIIIFHLNIDDDLAFIQNWNWNVC